MIGHLLSTLARYVRTPAARSAKQFGDEIEEEILFHLDQRAREYAAEGMTETEARRAAMNKFGDASHIARKCHQESVTALAMFHHAHLAMTLGLAIAVAALWLSSSRAVQNTFTQDSQLPPSVASLLDHDWTGDVEGRILDETGRPIDKAHVLIVVKTWPDHSYFQRAYAAISNSDGRFSVKDVYPIDEQYEVQVAAIADRRELKSSYHNQQVGRLSPIEFRLPISTGLTLKVEAAEGHAVAGVEVLPHGRAEANGAEHVVYFDSAQPIIRKTGADGRVDLPYFQPGDTATLMLRSPRGKWESRDIVVPEAGHVVTIRASLESRQHSEES